MLLYSFWSQAMMQFDQYRHPLSLDTTFGLPRQLGNMMSQCDGRQECHTSTPCGTYTQEITSTMSNKPLCCKVFQANASMFMEGVNRPHIHVHDALWEHPHGFIQASHLSLTMQTRERRSVCVGVNNKTSCNKWQPRATPVLSNSVGSQGLASHQQISTLLSRQHQALAGM